MNDEILEIVPLPCPFDMDEKIFRYTEDETEEPHSYNDFIEQIKSISGVSEDLMGVNY